MYHIIPALSVKVASKNQMQTFRWMLWSSLIKSEHTCEHYDYAEIATMIHQLLLDQIIGVCNPFFVEMDYYLLLPLVVLQHEQINRNPTSWIFQYELCTTSYVTVKGVFKHGCGIVNSRRAIPNYMYLDSRMEIKWWCRRRRRGGGRGGCYDICYTSQQIRYNV
jgi:hypothetical protein